MMKQTSIYFLILLILFGCTAPVDELSVLEAKKGVSFKVDFVTNNPLASEVIYWPFGSKDSVVLMGNSSTQHSYLLNFLKPETQYQYLIRLGDGYTTEVDSFSTDSLPAVIPDISVIISDTIPYDGFITYRKVQAPAAQLIADHEGNIRWYHTYDSAVMRPFIYENGTFFTILNPHQIDRVGLDGGNDTITVQDVDLHHSLMKTDSLYFALSRTSRISDLTSRGGTEADTITTDEVVAFDNNGNVAWRWSVFDELDPLNDPDIYKFRKDWGHANWISDGGEGSIIISFRDFNQIWKLDIGSGTVLWKIGRDGDYSINKEDEFIGQHSTHLIDDSTVLMFDNGFLERRSTRALSLMVDTGKRSVERDFSVFLPDSLWTGKQGSIQQLTNGNLLFDCSIKKYLVVTNKQGKIIWMAKPEFSSYRAQVISTTGK